MPGIEDHRRPPPPHGRDIDLLVVGEINPDVIVSDADPRPVFGQAERSVREIRLTIGGGSAITACGAARLGLRVALVGVVGDDAVGRFMLEALAARGVDISHVRTDPSLPTGASVILSSPDDRAILTARGAIGAVTGADVRDDVVARARHLHVGSWFLQRALWDDADDLFTRARAAGVTVSIDPNWDPEERWKAGLRDVLPLIDVVLPNAVEASRIAGIDDADAGAAAVALARLGPVSRRLVVVKAGAAGAVAAIASGVVASTPAYSIEAADTTGAGDSFDAGFLDVWLAGGSIEEALRHAAVCGALSTREVGGTEGQPTRSEVEEATLAWAR
ncbi:MAG TPA: carbohydrate kinase family protein [Candidatus Limnocylindrales bacterium]|jgi:sugar/nucleoside kinase (ribokinase family)|nr:carbohydrate kinase family protein [Candidatus Limnocylindrales bacterium]